MSSWLATALTSVTGGLVGGGFSVGTAALTHRNQRQSTIAAERRALDMAAAERAISVLAKLLQLDPPTYVWLNVLIAKVEAEGGPEWDPDQKELPPLPEGHHELVEAWKAKRDGLLVELETAAIDIRDTVVRGRLEIITYSLTIAGDMSTANTAPVHFRRQVCRCGIDCIGAYRRGEPLPDTPGWFGIAEADYETMRMNSQQWPGAVK
jgi:hypothetical protein